MKHILLTTAFALFTITSANASDVVTLPDGHTALNISATETIQVDEDTLVASLRIQEEAKDAKSVQKTINEAMAKAVALVKKYPSLKVVRPQYRYIKVKDENNKRVLDKWTGSQTLTIKSEVSEDVLNVTGDIQEMGFMMNGLNYTLSQKKHEQTRDGLMEVTVKKLRDRAMRVARALGKSDVDVVEINVDANNYNPRPVYARAMKMESMAQAVDAMPAPTAEAGETNVSMTIRARAIIK